MSNIFFWYVDLPNFGSPARLDRNLSVYWNDFVFTPVISVVEIKACRAEAMLQIEELRGETWMVSFLLNSIEIIARNWKQLVDPLLS